MDSQDREFESFLRQFHLRQPAAFEKLMAEPAQSVRKTHRWIFAAAAVVVVTLLSALFSVMLHRVVHSRELVATIEVAGDSSYKRGETIPAESLIRGGAFENTLLRLNDGSEIEMRAQSELSLQPAADGSHVLLNRGSIVVAAAKQGLGHLYVETQDTVVSVVGTVFFVDAEPSGTRVAVLEGEVEIRHGATARRVLQGEQASTDPSLEAQLLVDALSWSRRAQKTLEPLVKALPAATAPYTEIAPVKAAAATPRGAHPTTTKQEQSQQTQPASPQGQPQSDAGADGPGGKIFARACSQCHSTTFMNTQHYETPDAYAKLVSNEIAKGAMVSESEMPVLVDYLFKTYGGSKKNSR